MKLQGVHYGTYKFQLTSSSLAKENYGVVSSSSPSQEWTCNNLHCFSNDAWAICHMFEGDPKVYCSYSDLVLKVDITIPSDAIREQITNGKGVFTNVRYSYPEETVQQTTTWESPLKFTTGEAVVSLNSSIRSQQPLHVAGEPAVVELWVGNSGPSNARDSACDITVSHPDFVVLPSNCQTLEGNRLRCNGTGDISPLAEGSVAELVILPAADYRDSVTIEADNCYVFGTVSSMVSQVHSFDVTPVWSLAQSFAEDTESSLQVGSVAYITSLIHNVGPSSSLGSLCTWNFSVAALLFEGSAAHASNCEASYTPNLSVSCQVDAAPGDTTPTISVSSLPELSGTPSFNVSFTCLDEAGIEVGGEQPSLNVMFIEELGNVDVRVDILSWSSDEKEETKRQPEANLDGEEAKVPSKRKQTEDGAIVFDATIAVFLEANISGAGFARDVTCGVYFNGADAPLISSSSESSSSCVDHGVQFTSDGLPFWLTECTFEEMRAGIASKAQAILSVDPRVRELQVSVECDSPFPNTIQNPVAQPVSFHFVHVDAIDDDSSSSSSSSSSASSSSSSSRGESNSEEGFAGKWMWVTIGGGGGLLLILLIVPTLACIAYRRRRALQRKRRDMVDLESADEMEVYATPQAFSSSGASKQASASGERGIQWEIPFSELEFIEVIGKGGFGVVWRGNWRETPVAIKLFNEIMDSPALKENFKAEMNIMKNLRPHTNVVQLYGVCMEEDHPWCLVTEYLEKGDLKHFLCDNPPEGYQPIVQMAIQVARGMHHLHSEGIIHRDLAARNILLTSELSIKVGDFGLSSMVDESAGESKVPIRWTAPEALDGKGQATDKSDVWSAFSALHCSSLLSVVLPSLLRSPTILFLCAPLLFFQQVMVCCSGRW
ncbi:Mitogen-activated protein kinase kinase kinase 7, variant 2 [Balamuthia mandrillaris]